LKNISLWLYFHGSLCSNELVLFVANHVKREWLLGKDIIFDTIMCIYVYILYIELTVDPKPHVIPWLLRDLVIVFGRHKWYNSDAWYTLLLVVLKYGWLGNPIFNRTCIIDIYTHEI
jgi:hypothetical protein